jgi:hypothetical protein
LQQATRVDQLTVRTDPVLEVESTASHSQKVL